VMIFLLFSKGLEGGANCREAIILPTFAQLTLLSTAKQTALGLGCLAGRVRQRRKSLRPHHKISNELSAHCLIISRDDD